MLVVVQAVYVRIVPHLAASKGGVAMTLQPDAVDGELGQQVAFRGTAFDHDFREVFVHENLLQLRVGVKRHLDDFCLTIGVGGEVHHFRAWGALREIVLLVTGHRGHVETLDEVGALLAVAVHYIIYGTRIILLEDLQMKHVLADKQFLGHAHHLVLAVLVEDDDVVNVGTVAYVFILLQTCTDETVCAVDVQLLVGLGHLGGFDGVEVAYFCQPRMVLAVFVLQELEPRSRHLHKVGQVTVYLLNLCLDTRHQLVGFILVELQDALHLDFQQLQDVFLRNLAYQGGVVGGQSFVNVFADGINGGCLFKLLVFVDAFLDENLLQRAEVQLLL